MNNELEQLRLEKEKLELEKLRAEVAELKAGKERKQQSREKIEFELREAKRREDQRQSYCNHRKGGRGMEGLNGRGSDSFYAIVKHRFPQGHIGIICLRCQKMWMPGDAQYNEAMSFPTDNETSEASQFRIEVIK